jgi:iron complex transport system permease protein
MSPRPHQKYKLRLLITVLVALILGLTLGSVGFAPKELFSIVSYKLFGAHLPETIKPIYVSILWNIRFPRALMAFLVGACLAASGTVMQSILRNPLASSYTLGVSSGASLCAAFVIVTGLSLPVIGRYTLPFMGFIGGLGTVFLAISISMRFSKTLENHTIILVGMVISLFVNALLTVITSTSHERLSHLIFWQMGSFQGQTWTNIGITLPVLLLGLLVFIYYSKEMDLMTFGQEQALSCGVDTPKVKLILLTVSALLTGISVSFVGIIGFIDLIAPHIVRRFFGSKHRTVVPLSALLGGGFMVVCDLISRTIISPQELPIGAVTALIGAPFFAYLYFHKENKHV